MILIFVGLFVALLLFYVLWGRAWLKTKPWMRGFFDFIEPIEIFLWRKSETLLWARFLMVAGMIPPMLEQFSALKPLFDGIAPYLPANWQSYISLTFTILGMVGEVQRRYTTKPLEIVELPSAVPAPVAAALAKADDAKVEAVAAAATMPAVPTGAPLVKVE